MAVEPPSPAQSYVEAPSGRTQRTKAGAVPRFWADSGPYMSWAEMSAGTATIRRLGAAGRCHSQKGPRATAAPCWQSRRGPRARWGAPPGVNGPGAPSFGAGGGVLGRAADGNKLVDSTSSLLISATSGKALTNALCPALCPLCGGRAASLAPTRPPRRCPDLPRSRLLKLGAARTARCGVLRRRRVLSCSTGAL